jgi:hypothetical protein
MIKIAYWECDMTNKLMAALTIIGALVFGQTSTLAISGITDSTGAVVAGVTVL